MHRGNVVLLNGTSSAGKSSIARAMQAVMERPYLHTGVDHFLPSLPRWCFAESDGADPVSSEHFLLIYGRADGVLTDVRIGPGGLRLLAGMYRGIAALAAAGIDVIVDDVIDDQRVLAAAVEALRESPVLFVGLRLPLEEAERRERARGDRGPGGAATFFEAVHTHALYDLELDTAVLDPTACALRIKEALDEGRPRSAFRALAKRATG